MFHPDQSRFSWDWTSQAWPWLSRRARTTNAATTSSLVSQEVWIVLTQINFVFKLVEAPLSRPFAGPTREHTVSLFFRENYQLCTYIGFALCGEFRDSFDPFYSAVYIDMGLSSNSPVVLTVVTSGQSFARSFSVKVRICVCVCICIFVYTCIFVCICVCVCKVILGQGGKYDWTRPSVKHYLSTNPTNYTSSTKTWTLPLNQNLNTSLEPKHWHYSSTKTWTLPLSQNIDTTHQPKHWPSLNLNMHSILEHSLT